METSQDHAERLAHLCQNLTPEQVEALGKLTPEMLTVAEVFLPCLTSDPKEAQGIAEGLGAVSRSADGLVKLSSISEQLVLFSVMLPHIMRDAKRDEAWATVWEDVARRLKAVAEAVKNFSIIVLWIVGAAGVIYAGLSATGTLDGLPSPSYSQPPSP